MVTDTEYGTSYYPVPRPRGKCPHAYKASSYNQTRREMRKSFPTFWVSLLFHKTFNEDLSCINHSRGAKIQPPLTLPMCFLCTRHCSSALYEWVNLVTPWNHPNEADTIGIPILQMETAHRGQGAWPRDSTRQAAGRGYEQTSEPELSLADNTAFPR